MGPIKPGSGAKRTLRNVQTKFYCGTEVGELLSQRLQAPASSKILDLDKLKSACW